MHAKLLTLFTFLLACISSYSQKQTFNVFGTVRDGKGNPIAYASVFIRNSIGTTADANGKYKLNLNAGNHTIICQFIGYQESSQKIIISDAVQTLDFVLNPITSHLEDIIIKASKKDPSNKIIENAIRMKPIFHPITSTM